MEVPFLEMSCSLAREVRWERLSGAYWACMVDRAWPYTGPGRSIHCSLAVMAFQMCMPIDRMHRRSLNVGQIHCWAEMVFVVPDHMSQPEMYPRCMAQSRSKDTLAWCQQADRSDLMLDEHKHVRWQASSIAGPSRWNWPFPSSSAPGESCR
jgi:hypothetical protein